MGIKMPCFHRPRQPTLSQLGSDPPRSYLSNGKKLAYRSCIFQRETCSGNQPQPQCIFAQESNACLVLNKPCAIPWARKDPGFFLLRGHGCLAGGLLKLKVTPNGFSFGEDADWA